MTCRELYLLARRRLGGAGVDSPGTDAAALAQRFLGLDRTGLALHGEEAPPPQREAAFLQAVEERAVVGRYDGPEARVRGIFDLKNAGGSVAVDLPDGTYTDRITGREVTVSGGAFDLAQAPAVIG